MRKGLDAVKLVADGIEPILQDAEIKKIPAIISGRRLDAIQAGLGWYHVIGKYYSETRNLLLRLSDSARGSQRLHLQVVSE